MSLRALKKYQAQLCMMMMNLVKHSSKFLRFQCLGHSETKSKSSLVWLFKNLLVKRRRLNCGIHVCVRHLQDDIKLVIINNWNVKICHDFQSEFKISKLAKYEIEMITTAPGVGGERGGGGVGEGRGGEREDLVLA